MSTDQYDPYRPWVTPSQLLETAALEDVPQTDTPALPTNVTPLHPPRQSWRDYLPQLTPEQAGELTVWESRPYGPPMTDGTGWTDEEHQASLLFRASEYAEINAAARRYVDVPPPVGATRVNPWHEWDDGEYARVFMMPARTIGHVTVKAMGMQWSDGHTTDVSVHVHCSPDNGMTPEQAPKVAAALLELAAEINALGADVNGAGL